MDLDVGGTASRDDVSLFLATISSESLNLTRYWASQVGFPLARLMLDSVFSLKTLKLWWADSFTLTFVPVLSFK
jgi:hypothetical protein